MRFGLCHIRSSVALHQDGRVSCQCEVRAVAELWGHAERRRRVDSGSVLVWQVCLRDDLSCVRQYRV
jgi:hypothetical protein